MELASRQRLADLAVCTQSVITIVILWEMGQNVF